MLQRTLAPSKALYEYGFEEGLQSSKELRKKSTVTNALYIRKFLKHREVDLLDHGDSSLMSAM